VAYSEKYKYQWWGQPRTASRAMIPIQNKLGFIDTNHHNCTITNPNWSTIISIRNPYSRMVSFWILRHGLKHLEQARIDFEEFVKCKNEYYNIRGNHLWNPISRLKRLSGQVFTIRVENLVEDLMRIPLIEENFSSVEWELKLLSSVNSYRDNHLIDLGKPYSEYYTEELANIVYEKKSEEFTIWNYDSESWKTLKT
jgi:hypothetical protein